MNKRIRELAEQAGVTPGIMGINRFTYFDPEKFAELIIAECAMVMNKDCGPFTTGPGYKILEHFEIK